MNTIPVKDFNFQLFLGGRTKVPNLDYGARTYGGATKFEDAIYSNIETDDFIRLDESSNKISIFVPSTINVNQPVDNTSYLNLVLQKIKGKYRSEYDNLRFYNTEGSWLDWDNGEIVTEKITIVTVTLDPLKKDDICFFIGLAQSVKELMTQKSVSISINDALCLV